MQPIPLRTAAPGSYPFPGWLELSHAHADAFGLADLAELHEDAVVAALHDQIACGLDVLTDGEQARPDAFSHSGFLSRLSNVEPAGEPARRFGPAAHDQRARHAIKGPLDAPRGLGCVEEFERLKRLAAPHLAPLSNRAPALKPALKISVPGPYTLSASLIPDSVHRDRWAVAEALLPIVSRELERLIESGCAEIAIDEPAMSCEAHREDARRLVDIFNRAVARASGRCRLSTSLTFGNHAGRSLGPRSYGLLFPEFLDLEVDELHVEMASREFSELDIIRDIATRRDVSVGVTDVKSDYIESAADVAARVRRCLEFAPPERLAFAPDCGLAHTPRWAARRKLKNMCDGVKQVRAELGLR